jgi:hypothetical protein
MGDSIEEKVRAYSQVARLQAYDINASFGDEQLGRIEKRVVDKHGERHLDAQVWEAGDVAYQCLKQRYPKGITPIEYVQTANEFLSLACDVLYPGILELAEAGKIDIEPNGAQGLKEAWAEYGWCERLIFIFDFFEETIDTGADFQNPFNTVLPLVLLSRLDDAVVAEFFDGDGLTWVMLQIAKLRDRLKPPNYVQRAITNGREAQKKLDGFTQARRKGADAIHTENRAMKAEVFQWLETQAKFKSIESAAMAITKQQPIAHVTARLWYKEWKKLRSASTPQSLPA